MPKVEAVAHQALAAVATDAHLDLAVQWLNHRIQDAAAYGKFRFLRLERNVTWPGPITAGTVTIAQGDVNVYGDSTAVAAWSSKMVGMSFLARNVWYPVAAVETSGAKPHLTLEDPFNEATGTATSYFVLAQFLTMPDFRRIDTIRMPRLRREPLEIITKERLDSLAPSRIHNGAGMRYVAAAGETVDGKIRVEVYPYSNQAETLRVLGYRIPPELEHDSYLPGAIDGGILKEGILIDIYRYNHAKALNAGNKDAAMLWQQQEIAQERRWKDSRMLLALQDREMDDSMLQAKASSIQLQYNPEIVTAYDEVYARGRRP